jgi:hypothetical protein
MDTESKASRHMDASCQTPGDKTTELKCVFAPPARTEWISGLSERSIAVSRTRVHRAIGALL